MRKEAKGYRLIFGYLGIFLIFEGLVTLVPLITLVFYPSEYRCWLDFVIPGIGAIILGIILFSALVARRPKGRMANHEDALLLVMIWLSAIIIGSFPFYLTQFSFLNGGDASVSLNLSYTESFFESASGYTATGLTVFPSKAFLTGADSSLYPCAHVFLYHRAFEQFVGGVGLVLLVASVLSDRYNLKLYFAEGHNDKLMPNLGASAKLIFGIYFGYILLGSFSLWLAGMTPFDAICHSTSALATGGFSTRVDSYVYWASSSSASLNGFTPNNSLAIEIITEVLMLLGATNFALHTFLFRGKIKQFVKDVEIRFAFFIIVVFSLLSTLSSLYLSSFSNLTFWESLRYNAFNIISSITTTGYTNFKSVTLLGEVAIFSGILMMAVGGGLGSTAGGIKQYRFSLLLKDFFYSLRYHFSSSHLINPNPIYRLGQLKEEDPVEAEEAHSFALVYVLFFLLGGMGLMFLPSIDVQQAIYEFISALSGTGMTIIDFVVYKAGNPLFDYNIMLWVLSVGMIFGRLEILPVYFALQRLTVDPINAIRNRPHEAKEA